MCLASNHSKLLVETIGKIKEDFKELSTLHLKYNKKISVLYHEIEQSKYSASAGYNKLMELQETLRNRRVIKHEIDTLEYLMKTFVTKSEDHIHRIAENIDKRDEGNQLYQSGWKMDLESILNL